MKEIKDYILPFLIYNMTDEEIQYLKELDKEYGECFIDKRKYIKSQFPENIEEEFDVFMEYKNKGEKYFPILEYSVNNDKVNEIISKLESLKIRFTMFKCFLSRFYIELIEKHILTSKISLDPKKYYREYNERFKNTPCEETLAKAYEYLKEYPYKDVSTGRDLGSQEAIEFCEKHMKKLGFDYKVAIKKNQIPRMSVRSDIKKLYISDKAKFSQDDLEGLLAHEIKGHVARRVWGERTGLNLFKFGLLDHSIYDEGIAVWNSLNLVDNPKPNIYANISLNAVVAAKCEEMDFCELFDHLKSIAPELPDRKAFGCIIRVKRTFKYCELKGGDCEDAASYLEGYLLIDKIKNKDRYTKNNIGPRHQKYLNDIEKFFKYNKI